MGEGVRDAVRFTLFPDCGESVWEETFLHMMQAWVFDGIEGVFVEHADKGLMVDDEFEGGREAEEVKTALLDGPLDGARL